MGALTLVDSSVWIDFLRKPGDPANAPLRAVVKAQQTATTEPIAMELLMGCTDGLAVRRVEKILAATATMPVEPHQDFRSAAEIYRAVRRTGSTPRSSVDCLIAAIAIRHDVELLHKDRDFETIAEVSGLRHRSLG